MAVVASRPGRGSKPSAERPRGQKRARRPLLSNSWTSRAPRSATRDVALAKRCAQVTFSPAVSGGGHGALLGGGQGCKAHTSTPRGERRALLPKPKERKSLARISLRARHPLLPNAELGTSTSLTAAASSRVFAPSGALRRVFYRGQAAKLRPPPTTAILGSWR